MSGLPVDMPMHTARWDMGWDKKSSSIPSNFTECKQEADVAQLVEQPIRNRQVIGSSPIVGSITFPAVHASLSAFPEFSLVGPISAECQRILVLASEEAEHMGHKYIGTEHLFLGILREQGSYVARLLNENGLFLDSVREEFVRIDKTFRS
jgi:ATP-dependent Clp protease ATP-binding subunit ClpA